MQAPEKQKLCLKRQSLFTVVIAVTTKSAGEQQTALSVYSTCAPHFFGSKHLHHLHRMTSNVAHIVDSNALEFRRFEKAQALTPQILLRALAPTVREERTSFRKELEISRRD